MVSTYPSIPWINFNLSGLSSLCVQALQNQDLILANLKMLANQEQSKNVVLPVGLSSVACHTYYIIELSSSGSGFMVAAVLTLKEWERRTSSLLCYR